MFGYKLGVPARSRWPILMLTARATRALQRSPWKGYS